MTSAIGGRSAELGDSSLHVKIGDLFWTVSDEKIEKPQKISNKFLKFYDLADGETPVGEHNLKMLFLRKEGEHFYVDSEGKLQKAWFCGDVEKVNSVVNQTLALLLHRADKLQNQKPRVTRQEIFQDAQNLAQRFPDFAKALSEAKDDVDEISDAAYKFRKQSANFEALCSKIACMEVHQDDAVDFQKLSHFLYHFLNREGVIGRMSDKVGYNGPRGNRLFNIDLLQPHVDIIIGDHYWSVNTVTKKVSKALPIQERHCDVKAIDLSGDKKINQTLKMLFERKKGVQFVEKEGSLDRSVSNWSNRQEENDKVQKVVRAAIEYLNVAVKPFENKAVSIFLREKFQKRGPLARMSQKVFDRSSLTSKGGIEQHLEHQLEEGRTYLLEKLQLLQQYPLVKRPWQEIENEEGLALDLMKDPIYKTIKGQIEEHLRGLIKGPLAEELEKSLPRMVEQATCQWIRIIVSQTKEKAAAQKRLIEEAYDAQEIVEWTRSEIVRHEVKRALHKFLYAEFLFTRSLGIDLKKVTVGGSGGARFAFDRRGRKILVVKPDDEGPYGRNNPSRWAYVKQFFLTMRSCLAENSEPVSEVSSEHVDRGFGFNIVPSTSINLVNSEDFVGKTWKRCSVQTFISDSTSMQDLLKLEGDPESSWWRQIFDKYSWKARQDLLSREHMAASFESGPFADNLRTALAGKEKQFQRAFARFVIHNFLIQDTDCHFDNWLIKTKNIEDERLQKLLRGEEVDLQEIVDDLVEKGLYYQLHDALLHDEDGFIIIKHDGGSSMPHRHPTTSFETRLTYLFETLPQMKEVFTNEIKAAFQDEDRALYETILTVAIQNLVDVSSSEDFHAFWQDPANRMTFKKWLFMGKAADDEEGRTAIASILAQNYEGRRKTWFHWHYDSNLKRIKGIADTFEDRWVVLMAHLLESPQEKPNVLKVYAEAVADKSIKTLFGVKKQGDFRNFRLGHKTNPSYAKRKEIFNDRIVAWTREPVCQIEREKKDYATLQHAAPQLMRELA